MELAEYLPALRTANARMDDAAAEALLAHGWSARVPGCPGWTLADLVRHVAEVQRFWAWMVRTRATGPDGYRKPPEHPHDELLGWLDAQHAELEAALAGADPSETVWTWAPQQDVAFVLRRQLHESVVHTVDVEQVLGDVRAVPTAIGLDGLDEWLDVIVPATLPEGPPETAHPVTFHVLDRGVERTLFPGSRPFPIAALTGTAGDLLLTVWRRVPLEVLTVEGDGLQAEAMIDLVQKGSR